MDINKSEEAISRDPIKILVVDDREDNLFSIETILERDNYTIRKANSGRAALKTLLVEQDFTLILMDVQMPDMNGFETASLIYEREKLKHIPIIFITAHNSDETNMFEGYKMGAVDFIYKPINPDLLRFKVSVFVELYQKTHQLMMQERKLTAANANLEKEIEERRITEEKIRLLNEQLLLNNAELKAINEELDRFAYVASHDLQEPLRKILIFSDVVSMKLQQHADPDVSNGLKKIIKASGRMQNLINDLLQFSRHANNVDDFRRVDLNNILEMVLADVEVQVQQKEATVDAKPLPVIWGVPSLIQQLFQNLVSNSLKFCREDMKPAIQIHAEEVAKDKINTVTGEKERYYRIYFRDNGIGFDPKYAEDIFIVFKRLHSYHEFEGTGIGLSICKKIVEKHNGSIEAKSALNEGATFIITLPKKEFPSNEKLVTLSQTLAKQA
jgi:signal transduction histidine kinase